jgi:hypothetical protein
VTGFFQELPGVVDADGGGPDRDSVLGVVLLRLLRRRVHAVPGRSVRVSRCVSLSPNQSKLANSELRPTRRSRFGLDSSHAHGQIAHR